METAIGESAAACMVKPMYRIFKPELPGNFAIQWLDCFNRFQSFLADHYPYKPFIIRVFITAQNKEDFHQYSARIKETFVANDLPVSVVSQSPEKPYLVVIEAGVADSFHSNMEYGHVGPVKYCRIFNKDYSEIWLAGTEGRMGNSIYQSAVNSFSQLLDTFGQIGSNGNHIVRQWNYVEQIFSIREVDGKKSQHYQQFNEARAKFYSKHRTVPAYPAATGIGVDFNGVSIECCLIKGNETLRTIPISNPNQLDSYQYGLSVLREGLADHKKQTPQFERALLITTGKASRLMISGTAAIIGQETVAAGNVEEQTLITIRNIEALTSKSNLNRHCPWITVFPDKYTYVRVYVKNDADIIKVKSICRDHFYDVPMNFVVADICREDLLVEIEGEKIS